jgi:hypothetical protein
VIAGDLASLRSVGVASEADGYGAQLAMA